MTPSGSRSFTLLELLVAAMLAAALSTACLWAAARMVAQWNRARGAIAAAATAEFVLGQVEQDLEGAIFKADGNVWLAATALADTKLSGQWKAASVPAQAKPGNSYGGTWNPAAPSLADARCGIAGVWLRFFTTKMDTGATAADLSAPAAVGYQLIRQGVTSASGAEQRYMLFRAEVRRVRTESGAPGTFETGYQLDPAATPATAYMTANGTSGDPGNLIRPPLASVLADHVIDFGVRLYVRENGVLRVIFPATAAAGGGLPACGMLSAEAPGSSEMVHLASAGERSAADFYRHAFPDVAEIMVRVLDEEGARLIGSYEAGRIRPPAGVSSEDYWWTLAEAHSVVRIRRVAIIGRME